MSNQASNPNPDQNHKKTVMMLLFNDLRIQDNEALSEALSLAGEDGRLLVVYAHDVATQVLDHDWGRAYHFSKRSQARARFLYESLSDLDASLQGLNQRLLYMDTGAALDALIERHHVTDICVSQTADYAQNLAYDALQQRYPKIAWHSTATATLFVALPLDALPKSFTAFRKKVEAAHDKLHAPDDLKITCAPDVLPPLPDTNAEDAACFFESKNVDHLSLFAHNNVWQGGETSAIRHLAAYFDSDAPSTYKDTRNALDEWSHSTKFSAWLANGTLSVKVLLNRLRQYERDVVANESTYWIWFELLWREYFYWYAATHQKNLFLFQGIGACAPTTVHDQTRFDQWRQGQTLYPIVNACMHQLNATGYMSNRGRQLVASALIHELGLDWRYGATYFEQQLIDYDVASNWGNWQYLAGVGADPRGCRQFNLSKQAARYDPSGDFVHKWRGH